MTMYFVTCVGVALDALCKLICLVHCVSVKIRGLI